MHLDIFRQLARFSGGDPVVLNTLDDVSASADRTVMGLDIIADRYRRGDAVILPPRPVHHIVFNPIFNVVYGYRTYGNGPMDFFLRNIDHYRGIQSKSEFKSFDPGLYSALHGRGQFEAALNCLSISSAQVRKHVYSPRKTSPSINRFDRFKASRWYHSVHRRSSPRKKLSHEDAVAAHHSFEGNANFAARRMEIGRQTLVRHWKEHGLKTKGTHWQFRQQTKNKLKCQP